MRWKQISKPRSNPRRTGTYERWKEELAAEGFNQCVYCAIHDSALGGIRNFHVEHYKPKSRFPKLTNVYSNLFYACPICNTFKGNDWPRNPPKDHSAVCYPNPSKVNYCSIFDTDSDLKVIRGENVASRYLIEKLHLNRTQLIFARREHIITERISETLQASNSAIKALSNDHSHMGHLYLARLATMMTELLGLKSELHQHTPYTNSQTQ